MSNPKVKSAVIHSLPGRNPIMVSLTKQGLAEAMEELATEPKPPQSKLARVGTYLAPRVDNVVWAVLGALALFLFNKATEKKDAPGAQPAAAVAPVTSQPTSIPTR